MIDIVEQLRERVSGNDVLFDAELMAEARAEIERMRSHISHLEAHRDSLMAIVAKQALKIEQMRGPQGAVQ